MAQLKADVVVIAAGAAGLPASIAAAQSGAKVIVFEKGATTGGTGSMGMGPFGVESRLQKLKQMGPDRDQAFKMFMDYTHWRVDARLVRAYIDKAATTIDWLESLGVEFVEPAAYFPGGQFTWHLVKPEHGEPGPMAAGTMMKRLTDKAKELGVDLRLQTPVTKIVRTGDRVTGVVAETASGDVLEVEAPTVIVATGGFGDNPEMIKKFLGYEWGKDLFSFRVPGIAGDGIRMAWEVGAAASDMNIEMIYGMPAEPNFPMMALFGQPHLMVNLLGQRFVDESIMGNTTFTGNAIAAQKNKTAFLLFDSEIKQAMETQGFDHVHAVFRIPGLQDIDGLVVEAQAGGNHAVITADSLDELADEDGHRRRGTQGHGRAVQRVLRVRVRPAVQQEPPPAAAAARPPLLRRRPDAQRLRHARRHQDQRAHRGARQAVAADRRALRGRHRRLLDLRRLLCVHPAREHHGLRHQLRPHRRRERGRVRGPTGLRGAGS